MSKKVYKDIFSYELESENGRLSELPVGTTMILESLAGIDDVVWPEAYIFLIEEKILILKNL